MCLGVTVERPANATSSLEMTLGAETVDSWQKFCCNKSVSFPQVIHVKYEKYQVANNYTCKLRESSYTSTRTNWDDTKAYKKRYKTFLIASLPFRSSVKEEK